MSQNQSLALKWCTQDHVKNEQGGCTHCGRDYPLLTFIYPGSDCGSNGAESLETMIKQGGPLAGRHLVPWALDLEAHSRARRPGTCLGHQIAGPAVRPLVRPAPARAAPAPALLAGHAASAAVRSPKAPGLGSSCGGPHWKKNPLMPYCQV